MHYANVESKRRRFERRHTQLLQTAFLFQFEQAVSLLPSGLNAIEAVREEPVANALSELYNEVGMFFAENTYNALLKHNSTQKNIGPKFSWSSNILLTFATQVTKHVTSITSTIKDALTGLIAKYTSSGSVDEPKLRKDFSRFSKAYARSVARHAIVVASNMGMNLGAKATGLRLNKVWVSVRDQKTRIDHLTSDGQQVPINSTFIVGGESLQYPGDPSGSIANTVNCRCSLLFRRVE